MAYYHHTKAVEAHSSKLALFELPPLEAGIEDIEWVIYRPISQIIENAPIDFNIPANAARYLDLRKTKLNIKVKIFKGDTTPITKAEEVALVNLPLHSLFTQIDVYLQQVQINGVGSNYPYKAMLDTLLESKGWEKTNALTSEGFYQDRSSAMEGTSGHNGSLNDAFVWRQSLTAESRTLELEGHLKVDVCQQDRLILNGVPVVIKCWPAKPNFSLMGEDEAAGYHVVITEASVKMCCVKVHPGVLLGHNEALQTSPALYPYTKSMIKTFSIPTGQYNFTTDDLFQGEIPQSLLITFVSGKAYSGHLKANPFNYQHFQCNSIGFYLDGQSVPERALKPNFKTGDYMTAFMRLRDFPECRIDREDFGKGYSIFYFPLGKETSAQYMDVMKKGHTRLEIGFAEKTEETVVVIVYAKFTSLMSIDASRKVRF